MNKGYSEECEEKGHDWTLYHVEENSGKLCAVLECYECGAVTETTGEVPEVPKLPHTEKIRRLLKRGKRAQAIREHNETVKKEFDRAKDGEVIELSDLWAASEEIAIDEQSRPFEKPGWRDESVEE